MQAELPCFGELSKTCANAYEVVTVNHSGMSQKFFGNIVNSFFVKSETISSIGSVNQEFEIISNAKSINNSQNLLLCSKE